jgi:hypothetical protein
MTSEYSAMPLSPQTCYARALDAAADAERIDQDGTRDLNEEKAGTPARALLEAVVTNAWLKALTFAVLATAPSGPTMI